MEKSFSKAVQHSISVLTELAARADNESQVITINDFITWLPGYFKTCKGLGEDKLRNALVLYVIFMERHTVNIDFHRLLNTPEFGYFLPEEQHGDEFVPRPLAFKPDSLIWLIDNGMIEPVKTDPVGVLPSEIILTDKCKKMFLDTDLAFKAFISIYPKIQYHLGHAVITETFDGLSSLYRQKVPTLAEHLKLIELIKKRREQKILLPWNIIRFFEVLPVVEDIGDEFLLEVLNNALFKTYSRSM